MSRCEPRLANCAACPLGVHHRKHSSFNPLPVNHVAPNLRSSAIAIVVAQPDKDAIERGIFNADHGSNDLRAALQLAGLRRNQVGHVSMIACQYPGNARAKFMGKLKREGYTGPSPEDCCRPAFEANVKQYKSVIALGPSVTGAVLNGRPAFDKTRGTPTEATDSRYGNRVLLTWPGWMLRKERRFLPYFMADMRKALRMHADKLTWVAPKVNVLTDDNADELLSEMIRRSRDAGYAAYDIESAPHKITHTVKTDKNGVERLTEPKKHYNTTKNPLQCYGIGQKGWVLVIPYRSVKDGRRLTTENTWAKCVAALNTVNHDKKIRKLDWNGEGYDKLALNSEFGLTFKKTVDGMIMIKSLFPELPMSLAFASAMLTDAPNWKSGNLGTDASDDYSLWIYNAYDVAITADVVLQIEEEYRRRIGTYTPIHKQSAHWSLSVARKRKKLQAVFSKMSQVGVPQDEVMHGKYEADYLGRSAQHLQAIKAACGKDFNPNSAKQVSTMLYDNLGLPVTEWTKEGAPSTGKKALVQLCVQPGISEDHKYIVDQIRRFKLFNRLLTNPLNPMRPGGNRTWLGPQGMWRMHPSLGASGTVGARISSNAQQLPRWLKGLFGTHADSEYVLVEADYTAAEAICAIAVAGIVGMQLAIDLKRDMHVNTAHRMYGDAIWDLAGAPENRWDGGEHGRKGIDIFNATRQQAKTVAFASLYGGNWDVLHMIMMHELNKNGDLVNADVTQEVAQALFGAFHGAFPEITEWHHRVEADFRRKGYVEDHHWGCRRFLADGYKGTTASNFEIQSTTAGMMNDAIIELAKHPLWRPDPIKGTGMCLSVHDSLMGVIHRDHAKEAQEVLEAVMQRCARNPNLGPKGLYIGTEGGFAHNLKDI